MSQLDATAALPVGATAAAVLAWRHRGVLRVTVVAKATFAFVNDGVVPRVGPQPIVRAEVLHGRSLTGSTRFSSDMVPHLERAEIFFTGHACAPGGRPVESMSVRLGVFDGMRPILDKTLIVRQKGGFTEMPLVYERAYGGIGWPENPLGAGALPGTGEPSVFDPAGDRRLAGFAPIGGAWAARKSLLGTLSRRALEAPLVELPDDFAFGYFQAAPPDQRVPRLSGDEWIVMDGLHAALPRVSMRLPCARGLAQVYGLSRWGVAEGQPLQLHADTLRIDGEHKNVMVTFRGIFPVAAVEALAHLRVVAGVELPGEPIAWPTLEEIARLGPSHAAESVPAAGLTATAPMFAGTLALGPDDLVPALSLPFRPAPAAAATGASRPDLGSALPFVRTPRSGDAPPPVTPAVKPDVAAETISLEVTQDAVPEAPPPPEPAPVEPKVVVEASPPPRAPDASPWAPPPPPAPKAPDAPRAQRAAPAPSPSLKKGLYGKFSGNR